MLNLYQEQSLSWPRGKLISSSCVCGPISFEPLALRTIQRLHNIVQYVNQLYHTNGLSKVLIQARFFAQNYLYLGIRMQIIVKGKQLWSDGASILIYIKTGTIFYKIRNIKIKIIII